MLTGILTEGFIYGIMTLAVFYTFRMLNFADMTVDGSFPLGACVLAVCYTAGFPTPLALFAAFAAGALAGLVTALIHTRLKVPDLLSGILTMTMLYSVNLRIMGGRANYSLLKIPTLFSRIEEAATGVIGSEATIVLVCLITIVIITVLLDLFFRTDLGLCTGALGGNPQFVVSQGMNPDLIKIIGICLANGLVAFSGSYAAMYQGFADVNFGQGMIVSGLASLMIGEFFIKSNRISLITLRVILGSIVYRALMYLARNYGYYINMTANDLKLITGILILICITVSRTNLLTRKAKNGKA